MGFREMIGFFCPSRHSIQKHRLLIEHSNLRKKDRSQNMTATFLVKGLLTCQCFSVFSSCLVFRRKWKTEKKEVFDKIHFYFLFCSFVFRAKKAISCSFRVFLFFSQKPFLHNPSSIIVFLYISLFLPFQNTIFAFFCFIFIDPFSKTFWLFSFCSIFLSFSLPFLHFASFFQTKFPDIPFFKSKLL